MSDFNSTWFPELNYQVNNNETPTHYERKLDSFPDVSEKTGKVIIDTTNNVNTILIKSETKKETEKLNEDFKLKFIEKLKKLPDYEWSKVQEAIEKQTIEIKKIPWRDGYAIYESKVGNLVYITKLDWSRYVNVDYFRNQPVYEDFLEIWFLRWWYSKIVKNKQTWLWELFNKKWKKINNFSDEYSTATLNAINDMIIAAEYIVDKANKIKNED